MLLVVNIGNSNIRLGIFKEEKPLGSFTMKTHPYRSSDEYSLMLESLMIRNNVDRKSVSQIAISSVVPQITSTVKRCLKKVFDIKPLEVNAMSDVGLTFATDNKSQMGADLFMNALAAHHLYQKDSIIVDFGTALTFTIVSKKGQIKGVVIAPGVVTSLKALIGDTAKLPDIEIKKPKKVIGTSTVECIRSGMVYGYLGMVEGIIKNINLESGKKHFVIATGGMSYLYGPLSDVFDSQDTLHTIKGIQICNELLKK